jgi:hypothetical protein
VAIIEQLGRGRHELGHGDMIDSVRQEEIDLLTVGEQFGSKQESLVGGWHEDTIGFRVGNVPAGCQAELISQTDGNWAFCVRDSGLDYLSERVYCSKDIALKAMKDWLCENANAGL